MTAEQVNMPDDEQHQQARQHTGVQRKEARQCVMPVLGATDDELLHLRPGERDEVHQVGGDTGGPKSFLIPRQQVAGQRQGQHEQQQQDTKPVVHLTRRLVRAVDHDLHQVQQQQHRHELRRPVVNAAQQPAAGHLVLDVVDRLPRVAGAGAVAHPQKHAGDELYEDGERERAAPDVAPP